MVTGVQPAPMMAARGWGHEGYEGMEGAVAGLSIIQGAGSVPGSDLPVPSSERVYQVLKHRILAGMLEPGSRLVELQLATEFQVSRTPVREALKRLTAEGLLAIDALRGIVVSDVDARELEEIFVIRAALEGLGARLAAERVTGTDLMKLRLLVEMMRENARTSQWEAMVQANIKFHDVVHHAAGNNRLRHMTRNLLDFARRFSGEAFASQARAEEVLMEHERIIAALEARDPDRAEAATQEHVHRARGYLTSRYLSAAAPGYAMGIDDF
jgi:DNA-binding GntR family transcriptional regulator